MADEYIRREDAIEVINQGRLTKLIDADVAESGLKNLPAADVVPVVRCRDCKYNTSTHKCLNPDSFFLVPNDNDFCSYGERREE